MTPRRRTARKQSKLNVKFKKKWFGHLFFYPCAYCKKVFIVDMLTIEHIVPLCLGGTNDRDNITLACGPCNQEKGREAWFMKRDLNKKYNEQYYSQYRIQNRESSLQEN
ncbi:MAG TPA: HNH endonuclease signature motif containing protein [Candidatus Saccharimonadales bacterium]